MVVGVRCDEPRCFNEEGDYEEEEGEKRELRGQSTKASGKKYNTQEGVQAVL